MSFQAEIIQITQVSQAALVVISEFKTSTVLVFGA